MFHAVGGRVVHSLSFGDGPPIVGIAGAFASWEVWAPTFEILSRRWRTVSFDHDGVGQTKVAVGEITRDRQRQSLFSVLDAQGVGPCVLVGDSSNAALAIEAVLERPERFVGLGIVNGSAWGFDHPGARRFVGALREDFEGTTSFFVDLVFPEAGSDHLKSWLRDLIVQTGAEAAATIVESTFGLDLRPRLSEVNVPAIVIHGELDQLAPRALEDARELAGALDAELHVLQGAGHLPLFSRPDDVASRLDAFAARCFEGLASTPSG